MGTTCSSGCVGDNDGARVTPGASRSREFDPSQGQRSVFGAPSAQDDFLKRQRDLRKRNARSKPKSRNTNDASQDAQESAALFKKRSIPGLLPSDRSSGGQSSATLSVEAADPSPVAADAPSHDFVVVASTSAAAGQRTVANAMFTPPALATGAATAGTAAPPHRKPKKTLFFMPDA